MPRLEIGGRSMTVGEWSREPGAVSAQLIRRRLDLGWSHERAVFEPRRPAKVTREGAEDIRRRVQSGERAFRVARDLGLSRRHVGAIVHGKAHKSRLTRESPVSAAADCAA
jgi:hypothetical protein